MENNQKEEKIIDKIEWSTPQHIHKEHSIDWLWAIGFIAIVAMIAAIWTKNYLFAVFILLSGLCLIIVSIREPEDIKFSIETEGFTLGNKLFPWKDIEGFDIKREKNLPYFKMLLHTKKYFLPIYTILIPIDLTEEIKETLLKVTKHIELEESNSSVFMDKLGF